MHRTQHIITLKSGQRFITEAHTFTTSPTRGLKCPVSYVDVLYFETLSTQKPTVDGAEHYHTWNGTAAGPLTAWMVPTSEVKETIRKH